MITCTMNGKKYSVDYISGRALREIGPAQKMHTRLTEIAQAAVKGEAVPGAEKLTVADALDVLVKWFCILFGNQFTPDEVYDGYPADRIVNDITLALMAVQTGTTEVLSEFPTKAAETEAETEAENQKTA